MKELERIQILATWPDGIEAGESDAAAIEIRANGDILTRLVETDTGKTRDYVRASAVAMATWLADNWWRLRFEPYPKTLVAPPSEWRMRHELTSISGGVRWPPLMIYGTGENVVMAPRSGIVENTPGPLRYLYPLVVSTDGSTYEAEIDRFFATVSHECEAAAGAFTLSRLVSELKVERENTEFAAWRKLEAQLGFDPDTVPHEVMKLFSQLKNRVGNEGIAEAAMAAPGSHSAERLARALAFAENSDVTIKRNPTLELLGSPNTALRFSEPWRLAETVATNLRETLGLRGPIGNETFASLFSQSWKTLAKSVRNRDKLPYAAIVRGRNDDDRIALRSNARVESRRFELARALGDAAWKRDAQFAVLSDAMSERQKFQRAFAASFLCPPGDLLGSINTENLTDREISGAATKYKVSEYVVRTVLMNKNVLPRETLDAKLEAA